MKKLLAVVLMSLTLAGCTENWKAKQAGGTAVYYVEANEKVVNVTWKDEHLWIVTRARKEGEVPETFNFREKSNYGILEGTVKIIEK